MTNFWDCCCLCKFRKKSPDTGVLEDESTSHDTLRKIQMSSGALQHRQWLIEDFETVVQLGKGTFGDVYLVKHNDFPQGVALKILYKKYYLPDKVYKVMKEKAAWEMVSDHPHIVSLIGFFENDISYNFIAQYMPGGSLSNYIHNNGPFKENELKPLCPHIASAIAYIHSKGIIHRDISGKNVLLDIAGNAQLTDFGLCSFDPRPSDYCGTLCYLSPEILRKEAYGPSCDWYAFGVLLYKMLVGKTPLEIYLKSVNVVNYKRLSGNERLKIALMAQVVFPSDLSPIFRTFIQDLLRPDPEVRLGSTSSDQVKNHPFFVDAVWPSWQK